MQLIALFLSAFLAGSFVPLGSEAHLLVLYHQKDFATWSLLLAAGLGNTLGGMSCFFIAKWGGRPLIKKYLKHSDEKLDRWQTRLKNKSEWAALLCWLPLVGELIATVTGLLSNRVKLVFFLMFVGKLARYSALIALLD